MDHEATKRQANSAEFSITLPLPRSIKFEIRYRQEKIVRCEEIKRGEAKVFHSSDKWLLVHFDGESGKLRWALVDKNGLRELGEV